MTKKFNIHDWQDKQRNLTEQDEFQKRQDALTPGKNPDAFYGDDSLMSKMKSKDAQDNLEDIKKGKMVHLNQYFEDIGKMKLGDGNIDVGYAKIDLVPASINEQGFDSRFKDAMSGAGFSDDEQDDIMSRDVGSPFPGDDNQSNVEGSLQAQDLIEELRERALAEPGEDNFKSQITKIA